MFRSAAVMTALLLASVDTSFAQQEGRARPTVYKVEFNIRNGSSGADQAARHYTLLVDEARKGLLQAGSQVSVAAGSQKGASIDVGTTIECTVREFHGKTTLEGTLEISSVVPNANLPEPLINQRKVSFDSITLEPGVPTVVFDDLNVAAPASLAGLGTAQSVPPQSITSTPVRIGHVEATITRLD
jgi:hypothetical protein